MKFQNNSLGAQTRSYLSFRQQLNSCPDNFTILDSPIDSPNMEDIWALVRIYFGIVQSTV